VIEKYAELSIADLRALLDAYEVDHSSCVDKADLVDLLEKSIDGAMPSSAPSISMPVEPQFDLPRIPGCDLVADPVEPARRSPSPDEDVPEKWEHRLNVLMKKFPTATRSEVIKSLKKHDGAACIADNDLQELVEKKRINAERQQEIAMQDSEYQESLLMDQHRQAENKEMEAVKKKSEELERQKQAEKAQIEQEAAAVHEAKRLRVSQPEADKAHPDRLQIVIRTPSGKRLTRTFLGSDEVSFLYDWIDVTCSEENFVQDTYQVVSRMPGQPNKELPKSSRSLKEESVEHQSAFFVTTASS
jgi:hypothetical protein